MMTRALTFISFFVALVMATTVAQAETVRPIKTDGDWTAYQFKEKTGNVCFIASTPTKDEGNYTRRGDIFALVTHRPAENTFNVVSIISGYTFKKHSEVTVSIGSKEYKLFTDGDKAWARNEKTDKAIVNAMVSGTKMVVKGESSRGTKTKDTYSLKGFTATHKSINTACAK